MNHISVWDLGKPAGCRLKVLCLCKTAVSLKAALMHPQMMRGGPAWNSPSTGTHSSDQRCS